MGKHILQLNFPDCPNEGVFLVDDISLYDGLSSGISGTTRPTMPVVCANMQITPPGYTTPVSLSVIPGFHLVLNACSLGMLPDTSCANCCPELPDGLWNIRYSISPNDKLFVEYKILRTVQATNRYHDLLCRVGLSPCLPEADILAQLNDLDVIRNYLLIAKLTVENEHQFSDGQNLYKFAIGLMDKMDYQPRKC